MPKMKQPPKEDVRPRRKRRPARPGHPPLRHAFQSLEGFVLCASPVRAAIHEAIREWPYRFGALVDISDSLDIDVPTLIVSAIETELIRRDPSLKMVGRPGHSAADARRLYRRLVSFREAAEAAASSNDPVEAAMASLASGGRPVRDSDRDIASRLVARIKGRGRASLTVALEVLREEEGDLVRAFVGGKTPTEARKRLRSLGRGYVEQAAEEAYEEPYEEADEKARTEADEKADEEADEEASGKAAEEAYAYWEAHKEAHEKAEEKADEKADEQPDEKADDKTDEEVFGKIGPDRWSEVRERAAAMIRTAMKGRP